jgi:NADH-quinone oxidoreductase subunit L
MQIETVLFLIPLFPVLAFFAIILFANRSNRASHSIAVGSMAVSWALGLYAFYQFIQHASAEHHRLEVSFDWLPTGMTSLKLGFMLDPLAAITLFFVVWTCLMIFIYSVGYHNFGKPRDEKDVQGLPPHSGGIEPMYARFFAFISLFAFGMLLLVLSNNLLQLFVGWEIMGLCSYLLIGFWFARSSAREAAVKAFMTTRIGDVFMLLGIAYLYTATGTLSFTEILYNEHALEALAHAPAVIPALSVAGLAGLLIFIGTVGKSAQWPLHVWLPDAMEGPTPVSAMIHAATMVSAGVYLIIRFFPLISAGWHHGEPLNPTMLIIAVIGSITALFAATIAPAQDDIKRVLAYSTISQLGYMVAAVGIGAFIAAAFHLVTHAFFKALLFLGSGSVIHGMEHGVHHTHNHDVDPQDMFNMGGLRRKMPVTFATFLIGGLALAGFPVITAGFWSKDEILTDAFINQPWVFVILVIAAFLTAFYTMRQITLTFLGKPRTEEAAHAHESSWTMTVPLIVLSVVAVAGGWVGIPRDFPLLGGLIPNWFHDFVAETLLEHLPAAEFSLVPLVVSVAAGLGGLALGYLVYRRVPAGGQDPVKKVLGPVYTLLRNKYYFDEIYDRLFVRPAYWLASRFVYLFLDRKVIDGVLHWLARAVLSVGAFLRT